MKSRTSSTTSAAPKTALEALSEVIRKYPDTEYAVSARKQDRRRARPARRQGDGHRPLLPEAPQLHAGAINRFKTVVVTKYQNTRHVEEALARLTEAYMALGIVNEAQTAAVVLGHNFPDSPWYKDAYALVTTGGAVPREDKGSWISRAWKSVRRLISAPAS
jgi:outer membrane protein assembly factor BamD